VTAQLQDAIASGRFKPGDRLPSERELTEIFEVGRPTLREALRFLEAHGIIEIRAGKKGGSFVVAPSEKTLGNALSTLLAFGDAPAADLAEFRLAFEPENAWWAAKRATPDDLETLLELAATAGTVARSPRDWLRLGEVDARWHEVVARTTKNSIRIGISLGTHDALMRNHVAVMDSMLASGPDGRKHIARIARDMKAITAAIAQGDTDAARDAMREHVAAGNRFNVAVAADDSSP
jgi:GntR family transcriptional repressor for pyruvate dehydrogenase complex